MSNGSVLLYYMQLCYRTAGIIQQSRCHFLLQYLAMNILSMLNDIIILSLYEPPAHDYIELTPNVSTSTVNTYRFALG